MGIFVLWWKYYDGSGQGVIRAYENFDRANEDFELIKEDDNKKYYLDEVEFFKS